MIDVEVNGDPRKLPGRFGANIVCLTLGLGSLVSWNSMLTIGDYYYNLFPHYHPSRVLSLMYQPIALTTMAILAYNESKINTRWRNMAGFILFFLCTLALLLLDLGTSGKGGISNYIGVWVTVAGLGVADGHLQGEIVGDLSFMCPEFIQSFLAGMALSGALTSALRLITKAIFDKSDNGLRKGALLFLAISTLFSFVCIFLYAYFFPKLPIVKYYRSKAASEGSKTVAADLAAAGVQIEAIKGDMDVDKQERLTNKQLLFQNMDYAVDLFVIYALTLSIFPGFLFENTGTHHQLGSWLVIVLIAMYNAWDVVGRYLPLIRCLKIKSRKWLSIAVLSRLAFISMFYFAAKYGAQGWMLMLTSLLGITNGHLTVCVLTQAPKGYKGPEANALGNLLMVFLITGIVCGVALDWLWLIGSTEKF